jgi:antitoxin component HigA of HigAB toxin-antitoxin module
MVDDAENDPILLHVSELLDEHLLRDRRDCAFEIREAHNPASEQVKQDNQFPSPLEQLQGLLDAFRRRLSRVGMHLTFG